MAILEPLHAAVSAANSPKAHQSQRITTPNAEAPLAFPLSGSGSPFHLSPASERLLESFLLSFPSIEASSTLPTTSASASSTASVVRPIPGKVLPPATTPPPVAKKLSMKGKLTRCDSCLSAFQRAPTSAYSLNVRVYNAKDVRDVVKDASKVLSRAKGKERDYYCLKEVTTKCRCK